uniref:Uncharacterized protein n=1 Tax=Setaria viridis TaxID=4556 RepID=A0A4U6VQJ7_SETVI|nr:hypothetical protein SEVIR_2G009340v2 [Setaria viridis]
MVWWHACLLWPSVDRWLDAEGFPGFDIMFCMCWILKCSGFQS